MFWVLTWYPKKLRPKETSNLAKDRRQWIWGREKATPWRCQLLTLFGPFVNIIVREHVCFIVTCSILVHPVFLEKWISLSLFIQDNKTKKKAREQYWSDGSHPDCKRKRLWVSILTERHPFIKQTRNIPAGWKEAQRPTLLSASSSALTNYSSEHCVGFSCPISDSFHELYSLKWLQLYSFHKGHLCFPLTEMPSPGPSFLSIKTLLYPQKSSSGSTLLCDPM